MLLLLSAVNCFSLELASTEMKKIKGIVFMLIVFNYSIAQDTTNLATANLPFYTFLELTNDTSLTVEAQDSSVIFIQTEKIDSDKKWRLIGLVISDSSSHASKDIFPWTSNTTIYRFKENTMEIASDTLKNKFELNKNHFRKTRDWSQFDLSKDWTPFYHKKFLLIKKCDMRIASIVNSWTTYKYYFKEID